MLKLTDIKHKNSKKSINYTDTEMKLGMAVAEAVY